MTRAERTRRARRAEAAMVHDACRPLVPADEARSGMREAELSQRALAAFMVGMAGIVLIVIALYYMAGS